MISSMRDDATGRKEDGWMGQRFSDIFMSLKGKSKKSKKEEKEVQEANANDEIVWGDLEADE